MNPRWCSVHFGERNAELRLPDGTPIPGVISMSTSIAVGEPPRAMVELFVGAPEMLPDEDAPTASHAHVAIDRDINTGVTTYSAVFNSRLGG